MPEGQPAASPKDLHARSDITAQRPETMTLRMPGGTGPTDAERSEAH